MSAIFATLNFIWPFLPASGTTHVGQLVRVDHVTKKKANLQELRQDICTLRAKVRQDMADFKGSVREGLEQAETRRMSE